MTLQSGTGLPAGGSAMAGESSRLVLTSRFDDQKGRAAPLIAGIAPTERRAVAVCLRTLLGCLTLTT